MRVAVLAAAVCAAAALSGCRGNDEQPEVQKFETVSVVVRSPQTQTPGPAGPAEVTIEKKPVPEEQRPSSPSAIAVGMSRDDLVAVLGDCAQRIAFTPSNGHGSLVAETFQPKAGDCEKKFDPRRFFVVGGAVKDIQWGVDEVAARAAQVPSEMRPPRDDQNK